MLISLDAIHMHVSVLDRRQRAPAGQLVRSRSGIAAYRVASSGSFLSGPAITTYTSKTGLHRYAAAFSTGRYGAA
jgi:hypothetical protein